jgi:hypothetical protein
MKKQVTPENGAALLDLCTSQSARRVEELLAARRATRTEQRDEREQRATRRGALPRRAGSILSPWWNACASFIT